MSNALAVATVTQALALLIESNLGPELDLGVQVVTRKPPAEPPVDPTINVFLYQVTPNASMRNNDLPTRASDGKLVNRPVAPLDLHYLISAYGEETELVGQRLIGSVVRALHEIPVLPKELIELAAERPYLSGSDLAESLQKVRFTPTVMDIDETSKLWGMLHQTPYTLSVAYQATLVVIEGREKPVPAKPVEERTVRVLPFGAPGAPVPPGSEPSADEAAQESSEVDGTDASGSGSGSEAKPRASTGKAGTAKAGTSRSSASRSTASKAAPSKSARSTSGAGRAAATKTTDSRSTDSRSTDSRSTGSGSTGSTSAAKRAAPASRTAKDTGGTKNSAAGSDSGADGKEG